MGTRARRRLLIAPAVFLAYLVLGVGPAGAQETTTTVAGASPPTTVATVAGPAVGGRLVDRDGEPVEGVGARGRAQGDEVIDRATTDENGEWQIEVPEPDTSYSVTLDVDTLPEGVGLRDPDRDTLDDVRVRSGLKVVLFPLGEPTGSSPVGLGEHPRSHRRGCALRTRARRRVARALTRVRRHRTHELRARRARDVRCARRVLLQRLGVPVPAPGRRASGGHRGRRVRRGERARAVSPAAQAALGNGVAHRRDDRARPVPPEPLPGAVRGPAAALTATTRSRRTSTSGRSRCGPRTSGSWRSA